MERTQGKNGIIWPGAAYALLSALLFGLSTPLAKLLLGGGVSPWMLAGLLYLGSGVGLAVVLLARHALRIESSEASLRKGDWLLLVLVVASGGVAGPVLLMLGLSTTPASSASLLLNVEGVATMAIAWVVFRENVDDRLLVGAAAILGGGLLLSWHGTGARWDTGSLLIAGSCLAWGIDNNLTRRLSSADPLQITMVKGLVAGSVNLALALSIGARIPMPSDVAGAMAVGLLGYGVSLALFVLGLRHLGAARTGAYFATAPFVGALVSFAIFHDALTLQWAASGLLMAIGVYLHLTETHAHEHTHEPIEHEHRHIHDEHHRHGHEPIDPAGEPHSHWHRHEPLRHKHPHYPDVHHRHDH